MRAKNQLIKRKQVLVRAFDALQELDRVVVIAQRPTQDDFQISVLGKLENEGFHDDDRILPRINEIRQHWQGKLGKKSDFGWFRNQEIGALFIAGSMAPIFMHPIDGKTLGAMSSGPYGILRGLGIGEEKVMDHINKLLKGELLLIIRGHRFDLEHLADQIDTLERAG